MVVPAIVSCVIGFNLTYSYYAFQMPKSDCGLGNLDLNTETNPNVKTDNAMLQRLRGKGSGVNVGRQGFYFLHFYF